MRNSSASSSSDFPLLSSFMQRTIMTRNSSKSTVPLPVNVSHDVINISGLQLQFKSEVIKTTSVIYTKQDDVAFGQTNKSQLQTNKSLLSLCCECFIKLWLNLKNSNMCDVFIPSSSTSSIISCNSSGVGFCPSILITFPSSLVLMQPSSASWMKMSKAALNSEMDTTTSDVWQRRVCRC